MPSFSPDEFPGVWAHRGASIEFPENTMASFEGAMREGANGIESDVHLSKDGRILMFHDPRLDRTTDGTGAIKEQNWAGCLEHVRTTQEPKQQIPLFEDLLELLMRPENRNVIFNIDVKPNSDPESIFPVMAALISQVPDHVELLDKRLILGLWHPTFIASAEKYLPTLSRFHIGMDIKFANDYFFDHVDGLSMWFSCLVAAEGQAFIKKCKDAGKAITVWTVNDKAEMAVAITWDVQAVLTDTPAVYLDIKNDLAKDKQGTLNRMVNFWTFPWMNLKYYSFMTAAAARKEHAMLRKVAGEFAKHATVSTI